MDQIDDEGIHHVLRNLTDSQILAGLHGACRGFDKYLELIGAGDLAVILREGLPELFQRDPVVCAKASHILQSLPDNKGANWPDASRRELASLLAVILDENDELRGEVTGILQKALWKTMASVRRDGGSNFWTLMEDRRHEELLMREYSGVEAGVFNGLKRKLRDGRTNMTPPISTGATTLSSQDSTRTEADHQKSRPRDPDKKTDAGSEILAFPEFQAMLRNLDPATLNADWKTEPRKTLLWFLQNGTQEQVLVYIYENSDTIDDPLRESLLNALAADEVGQIPIAWRTILLGALLGAQGRLST